MNPKVKRIEALRKLISSNRASNQEDILAMLAEEGYVVSQATLSRDLQKLKVAKTPDGKGGYSYYLLGHGDESSVQEVPSISHASSGIISIEFSGQFGVIKTRPGYANMIGTIVDSALKHKIMGTIAGDDTLLMLLREGTAPDYILSSLEDVITGISVRRI